LYPIVRNTLTGHIDGILRQIRELYAPEIFSINVEDYQIDDQIPHPRLEDIDLDDYRHVPLCRIQIGMTDLTRSNYEALLSLLRGTFTVIDAFHGLLLAPTLETSLEKQQSHWKILEYHVIDEKNCIWVAKAKQVHLLQDFPGQNQQEPIQTLLITGWQCLTVDEKTAHAFARQM